MITSSASTKTASVSATLAAEMASRQVLRYAGYVWDATSGTYHLSAREYDPLTRSFLTKDPAGADGEGSPYQYCAGDPVGKVDASGLMADYSGYGRNTSLNNVVASYHRARGKARVVWHNKVVVAHAKERKAEAAKKASAEAEIERWENIETGRELKHASNAMSMVLGVAGFMFAATAATTTMTVAAPILLGILTVYAVANVGLHFGGSMMCLANRDPSQDLLVDTVGEALALVTAFSGGIGKSLGAMGRLSSDLAEVVEYGYAGLGSAVDITTSGASVAAGTER